MKRTIPYINEIKHEDYYNKNKNYRFKKKVNTVGENTFYKQIKNM